MWFSIIGYMKKEKNKKSKMTIDKLAIMVANGFESIESRMATKEDLNAQQKTLKIHGDVLRVILKEIKAVHEDSKSFLLCAVFCFLK
jgi:hypothetical protein